MLEEPVMTGVMFSDATGMCDASCLFLFHFFLGGGGCSNSLVVIVPYSLAGLVWQSTRTCIVT